MSKKKKKTELVYSDNDQKRKKKERKPEKKKKKKTDFFSLRHDYYLGKPFVLSEVKLSHCDYSLLPLLVANDDEADEGSDYSEKTISKKKKKKEM